MIGGMNRRRSLLARPRGIHVENEIESLPITRRWFHPMALLVIAGFGPLLFWLFDTDSRDSQSILVGAFRVGLALVCLYALALTLQRHALDPGIEHQVVFKRLREFGFRRQRQRSDLGEIDALAQPGFVEPRERGGKNENLPGDHGQGGQPQQAPCKAANELPDAPPWSGLAVRVLAKRHTALA